MMPQILTAQALLWLMNVDEYTHPASMYVFLSPAFQLMLILISNTPSANQEPQEKPGGRVTRGFELEMSKNPAA